MYNLVVLYLYFSLILHLGEGGTQNRLPLNRTVFPRAFLFLAPVRSILLCNGAKMVMFLKIESDSHPNFKIGLDLNINI